MSEVLPLPALIPLKLQETVPGVAPSQKLLLFVLIEKDAARAGLERPNETARKIRIPDNCLTRPPPRSVIKITRIVSLTAILTETATTSMRTRFVFQIALSYAALSWTAWSQVKPRGLEHPELARKDDKDKQPGRTYAVLIGVSHYKNDPPITSLQFADKDAETFAAFLRTPLGGALDPDDIRLLTNQQATRAAMDAAIKEAAERKGGANNTLI